MSKHPIVHVEFSAKKSQDAAKFYDHVFGWRIEPTPGFPDYMTFEAEGGPGGGFPEIDGKLVNAGDVLAYIGTDDIEASLTQIEAHGGKTLLPKSPIPHIGWFAFFSDPSGNQVGLYKSDPSAGA